MKQASEEKKTEYAEDAENEQTELPNNSGGEWLIHNSLNTLVDCF